MEILKRLDKYKKFLNVLLGIFGFVTLAFGVFTVIFTFVFADEEGSLNILLNALINCVGGILFLALARKKGEIPFSTISFLSFVENALFFWVIFMFAVSVYFDINLFDLNKIWSFYWISLAVAIAIWFGEKFLNNKKKLNEAELMKLDLYSTVALLLFTIIWVLFDIDEIKYGFAVIMAEFMVIQILIKHAQIIHKEMIS